MASLISIYIGGILTLFVAIFHTQFPVIFKWKEGYKNVSENNRKIFHTIHLKLLILLLFSGFVTLIYAPELSESTGLSFGFNIMISGFWLWRVIWQIYYFKGRVLHYLLVIIFSVMFLSYLTPVILTLI